jgi:hypothetical protein
MLLAHFVLFAFKLPFIQVFKILEIASRMLELYLDELQCFFELLKAIMLRKSVKERKTNLYLREGEGHVNIRANSQDCEVQGSTYINLHKHSTLNTSLKHNTFGTSTRQGLR